MKSASLRGSFIKNPTESNSKNYITNVQGDILGITDKNANVVAKYTYDAWGKHTAITNASGTDVSSNSSHIANINPLRYRGYYFDTESGFYYLRSRYYDPVTCRFLNADGQLNISSILGYNLFAYCRNNPVNRRDSFGQNDSSLAEEWATTMWWLCAVDGPIPVGDIVYGGGVVVGFIVDNFNVIYNFFDKLFSSSDDTPAPSVNNAADKGGSSSGSSGSPEGPEDPNKIKEIVNGIKVSTTQVLEMASEYLGKGYREMGNGTGRFVSADGLRQVRMGVDDLLGLHYGGPHVNFDILSPIYKTIHIFFID